MRKNYMLANSITVFSTSLIAAVFTYLFSIFMARRLGPVGYGSLGSLQAIFLFFSVSVTILNLIVMKFTSYFKAKSQPYKISELLSISVKMFGVIGIAGLAVTIMLSSRISAILGTGAGPVIMLGILILFFLLANAFMAVLNGLQRFLSLGIVKIVEAAASFAIAALLVGFGMGVSGAIAGMAAGAALALPLCILLVHDVLMVKKVELGDLKIVEYAAKATVIYSCLSLILNVDIIVVKLSFDSVTAGLYAAVSMLGSLIFFVSSAVASIIFPKAAELHSNGNSTSHLLKQGLLTIVPACAVFTLAFFIFPEQLSEMVFGKGYPIARYVGLYALAMSFLGIANVIITYQLSLKQFSKLRVLLPAAPAYLIGLVAVSKWSSHVWQNNLLPLIIYITLFTACLLFILVRSNMAQLREAASTKKGYIHAPYKHPFKLD